jgi:hypothetical protein
MAELKDTLRGRGRIVATARMPEIDAYIRKVHGKARPLTAKEGQVIRGQVNAQMRVIRRNWPVRTGTSRAGWTFFINPSPGKVSVIFENPVFYSGWVTRKGQQPVRDGGTPWYQVLVGQVWKANQPRLMRLLKAEIDKTEALTAKKDTASTPPSRTQRRRDTGSLSSLVRRLF